VIKSLSSDAFYGGNVRVLQLIIFFLTLLSNICYSKDHFQVHHYRVSIVTVLNLSCQIDKIGKSKRNIV